MTAVRSSSMLSPILAVVLASPIVTAQADEPASLPRVVVIGSQSNEDHYRVDGLDSVGPLGRTPILDIPYTVSILPLDLIENSQATNFKDVSKYLPLVTYQEQQGPEILRPQTRGMQGGNFQNSRIDGMTVFITVATALEQFQQIEVINGPSASLYGPANPSGMFNFVSKRPTETALRQISVTYNSNSVGTAHADIGGPIDNNGILSYRLNALYGAGDGYVEHSRQKRVMGDLAVDVRPREDTVLELNYSDYHLIDTGYPGWFTYGEKIFLPTAPNPQEPGYGQNFAGVDLETRLSIARIKHDFGSNWHLVVGALNQDASRNISTPVNNLTTNSGSYVSSLANGFAPRFVMTSDAAYLNGGFETAGLGHDLTIGTAGYRAQSYSVITPATPASVRLGAASIDSPAIFPYPAAGLPNPRLNYDSSTTYQQGVNLNDTLRFSDAWAARLGVSQDWFHVDNYTAKGRTLPEYANHGLSPTGSVLFKPRSNMTTYFTFASSLQAGDLAPGTPGAPNSVVNAGSSLAPYRSKEYEVGYKATVGKLDLTAALFRIERPFANIDPTANVFRISGKQINRGLELSAIGELLHGLTVFGGVTMLNARLDHTPSLATDNKLYVGAPKVKGNVLFEYRYDTIPGLATTFNWQFSGPRAGDDTNTFLVAGYNLFDLGARYTVSLRDVPVTARLAVNNLADRYYWSTIGPSNLTGANTGSLLAHLGTPRTVLASISAQF